MTEPLISALYPEEIYQLPAKTCVVVKSWNKLLSEEIQLLSKILGAVRLSLDGVQIVEQSILNITDLSVKPRRIICFTDVAAGLTSFESMEVDGVLLVISPALGDLLKDEAARKKLWGALKAQFSV